jgi:hypothetical protein
VSRKSVKIAAVLQSVQGEQFDPHYLGYFECFNRQLFFEAHEVLEELWLPQRGKERGLFYQGLIQLAGAFVHLQKNRLGPAASLFKLARENLNQYPAAYEGLDVAGVQKMISQWLARLDQMVSGPDLLKIDAAPKLFLTRPSTDQSRVEPRSLIECAGPSSEKATGLCCSLLCGMVNRNEVPAK